MGITRSTSAPLTLIVDIWFRLTGRHSTTGLQCANRNGNAMLQASNQQPPCDAADRMHAEAEPLPTS